MKRKEIAAIVVVAYSLMVCLANVSKAEPMGTAWTYQGRLLDANGPPDGLYDFEFKLFDDSNTVTGNQLGSTIDVDDLDVIDGYFTVVLDFNDPCAFNGEGRWLEIDVRPGEIIDPNAFVTLSPRQKVTPTPYALYAKTAGNALSGSGTDNRIAKFTGANALGDSLMYEFNGYMGMGTTNPRGMFDVDCDGGDIYLDTFSAKIYIGDVDGDGDETLFTLHDGGKFIFENGNVGIGTDNPLNDLHVYDSGGDAYVLTESVNNFAFYIADGHKNSGLTMKEDGTTKANVYWSTANDCLILAYGNSERLVIKGDNVGIGTTAPGSRLDIKASSGSSAGGLRITSSTNDNRVITLQDATPGDQGMIAILAGGSNKIVLRANGDTYFSGGDVGIGKTSPSQRLDVTGNAVFSGRVGIGTTSPGVELDVRSGSTNSDVIDVRASDGSELFNVKEGTSGDGMVHVRDRAGSEKVRLNSYGYSFFKGGNVAIGDVGIPQKKLVVRGNILVKSEGTGLDVLELGQGLDYAEGFDVTDSADIEPGTVLVIDSENPGKLRVGQTAYDSKVAGIVAGANGIGSGVRLGVGQFDYDVALAGRVYCKVDATEEAVQAGDQLTTSGTAGHAMKATDYDRARGAVLGKAMESLAKGKKGKILVLVTLQ
jgi:hypothetical protein